MAHIDDVLWSPQMCSSWNSERNWPVCENRDNVTVDVNSVVQCECTILFQHFRSNIMLNSTQRKFYLQQESPPAWTQVLAMLLCLVGGYPIPGMGVPQPGLDGGGTPSQVGGYPSQVLMVGWGTPSQLGGYPGQVLIVGGYPTPGWGVLHPRVGRYRSQIWMVGGTPTIQTWPGYSEHLLCIGQYASCVHTGGLSCCK